MDYAFVVPADMNEMADYDYSARHGCGSTGGWMYGTDRQRGPLIVGDRLFIYRRKPYMSFEAIHELVMEPFEDPAFVDGCGLHYGVDFPWVMPTRFLIGVPTKDAVPVADTSIKTQSLQGGLRKMPEADARLVERRLFNAFVAGCQQVTTTP
jgi:hypothetical protein